MSSLVSHVCDKGPEHVGHRRVSNMPACFMFPLRNSPAAMRSFMGQALMAGTRRRSPLVEVGGMLLSAVCRLCQALIEMGLGGCGWGEA